MSMRIVMARAAGGLVIALGAGLNTIQAQGVGTDQQLVTQVAASNLLEVRLGQIAHLKGANVSVREFGQQMVNEHSAMQKQWMGVAKNNRLTFRADLTPAQLQQFESLNKMTGAEFDRAYMDAMVQNHRTNVSTFQLERNGSHSSDVRQLIEAGLPSLEQHLSLAQQLGAQVGVTVTASGPIPPATGSTQPQPQPQPQPAQPAQSNQAWQNVRADSAFIVSINASDSAELRLARLAETKATDNQVKVFARRLMEEHGALEKEWRGLSTRSGLPAAFSLNPRQQRQIHWLEGLSGAEFDRAYASTMVQSHQENLNSLQTRGGSARSAEVRQLVNRTIPAVQGHLTMAQELSTRLGGVAMSPDDDNNAESDKKGNVNADAKFIRNVDADHFLEIRLGRLAESKASNQAVKEYGRRMVRDHTSLQTQWTSMASSNGMKLKSGMGPRHKSKLTRMEKMSGRVFDREYMTLVAQNHQDYLDYFRKEGRGAKSAPVRQLVNRNIPMLERHIRDAKQIGATVGADTTTTRYGKISAN